MFRFSRHGWREMLIGSIVLVATAVVAAVYGGYPVGLPLSLLLLPILLWLFAFFRDPERVIPVDQNVLVSPADGTVSDVTDVAHDELLGGPAVRVGIFLSVFNVHVNRSPCDGKVLRSIYKKGKFINAMKHNEASEENESNTVLLGDPTTGAPTVVVKQIVGLIARRIIFTAREGDALRRGERIGMIKFGSRTELTVAKRLRPHVRVRVGQTVRGGADVVVTLEDPIHAKRTEVDAEEFEPTLNRNTPA